MEKDLQGWFLLPHPTRRYWCRHWLCLRACCFTDVHSCLVIMVVASIWKTTAFCTFSLPLPILLCCVIKVLSSLACSLSRGSEERLGLTLGCLFQHKLANLSQKAELGSEVKSPKICAPSRVWVFSILDGSLRNFFSWNNTFAKTSVNY